jgi:formate dehydrogenase major subunit
VDVYKGGNASANERAGGEIVRVQSRYGQIGLPVQISRSVKSGELFAAFHDAKIFLNRLTSSHRNPFVQSPEYKITAVRVE